MMEQAGDDVITTFRVDDDTLIIDLGQPRTVLSSAPYRGGLLRARYILNHQVPSDPIQRQQPGGRRVWGDPSRYLSKVAVRRGAHGPRVGLMTAVPMTRLVVMREQAEGLWVEGFLTVGVSNAVRAGAPLLPPAHRSDRAMVGTINIILVTNARLTASAMVGVVQVMTESKTAVLLDEGVPTWDGGPGATGTGTDAVVVASGDGPTVRYSGTHTALGEVVGRLVGRGVREGLTRYRHWVSQAEAGPECARSDDQTT